MKKRKTVIALLLVLSVMVTLFVVPVAAADKLAAGFYGTMKTGKFTVTPQTADGTTVKSVMAKISDSKTASYYENSVKLDVKYTDASIQKDIEVVVMLVTGDSLPTQASSICYINQKASVAGSVSFTVYPNLSGLTENDTALRLYVTSAGFSDYMTVNYAKVNTYEKAPYKLGDVNNDGLVDSRDATLILRKVVGDVKPEETYIIEAADCNLDGTDDSRDAVLILRYVVGDVNEDFTEKN